MLRKTILAFTVIVCAMGVKVGWGGDSPSPSDLDEIKRQIRQIKAHEREEEEQRKADKARDENLIGNLEHKVEGLESLNRQLTNSSKRAEEQAAQAVDQLHQQEEAGPSPSQFSTALQHYMGSHTFQVTGAAGMDFVADQQSHPLDGLSHETQNTFLFDWEPMVLYRPTDWILFEGVFSGRFSRTGAVANLSIAEFQLLLNDYMTVVGGLFDNPFGDWFENQSPMWVNRFVTAPLPFGVEAVVPPSEIGVQFRGGMQWGQPGQDFDYTLWTGNGPSFSEPVLGAALGGPVAVAPSQTNGKSFGARFRVYPLPLDANLGRLELGTSTYDAKWLGGHWLNTWGVDFSYFAGSLQARGEWLQSYRQMPGGLAADNRQGWYLQLGYFLNRLQLSFLPDTVTDHIRKLEPLVRYSGVNQRGVAIDDITGATGLGVGGLQAGLIPDFGLSGSPALFTPHSREVALGLDYWIAPSIVWQNEFDIELPREGGLFVRGDGTTTPVGSTPNDHAFLSQFTIGF